MAESQQSNYHQSASTMEVEVNSLRLKLSGFSDACQSPTKFSFYAELDEISNWVEKQQQKKEENDEEQISIEKVRKVLIATTNGIEKFKSKDSLEATRGVLGIISTVGKLFGGPYGGWQRGSHDPVSRTNFNKIHASRTVLAKFHESRNLT